jgi:predicted transcriptional regulator
MAEREELLQLAADIVSTHASNSALPADQLPKLIQQVYSALATAHTNLPHRRTCLCEDPICTGKEDRSGSQGQGRKEGGRSKGTMR